LSSVASNTSGSSDGSAVSAGTVGGAATTVLELLLDVYALVTTKCRVNGAGSKSIRAEEAILISGV